VIYTSEFLESMLTPLPAGVPLLTAASQAPDITMPSCIYCPDPSYSDLARREKIQGHNLFHVVVTSAGEAEQIRPVKMIGHGLDEQAYYAIKKWKFKPATLKTEGTPVKVIVPVEVAFRLH
jgi:TonB family protein